MKLFTEKRSMWLVPVLLLGLGWTAGCSENEEDVAAVQEPPPAAETNGADEAEIEEDAEADEAEAPDEVVAEKVAPQPVLPADQAVYPVLLFNGTAEVTFEWTAVPGVDSYYLEIPGVIRYVTSATTYTRRFPVGEYTWRIWSRYPETETTVTEGPASGWRRFEVRQTTIVIIPP